MLINVAGKESHFMIWLGYSIPPLRGAHLQPSGRLTHEIGSCLMRTDDVSVCTAS